MSIKGKVATPCTGVKIAKSGIEWGKFIILTEENGYYEVVVFKENARLAEKELGESGKIVFVEGAEETKEGSGLKVIKANSLHIPGLVSEKRERTLNEIARTEVALSQLEIERDPFQVKVLGRWHRAMDFIGFFTGYKALTNNMREAGFGIDLTRISKDNLTKFYTNQVLDIQEATGLKVEKYSWD
jgi:hypothetical protein